jgi:hypothetical protein
MGDGITPQANYNIIADYADGQKNRCKECLQKSPQQLRLFSQVKARKCDFMLQSTLQFNSTLRTLQVDEIRRKTKKLSGQQEHAVSTIEACKLSTLLRLPHNSASAEGGTRTRTT